MGALEQLFEFGRFRLDADKRVLSADGAPLAISARAFDILHLLIELRDRVVTKDEIFERVWHGMIVEENNLAVHISALRRLLADQQSDRQLIVTVPGRGYRFVGEIAREPSIELRPIPAETPAAHRDNASPRAVRIGIATLIVVLVVVGLYLGRGLVPPQWINALSSRFYHGAAPRLSIAVLPFRNLSDDPEQSYLADAISDDLTTDLSHLPRSVVIARTSADTYKGSKIAVEQIGQELGVRYLLEGSLRHAGDRILINAQLIDTENGAHLWAERFDVPQQQLPDTQVTIVRHITSALNFRLVQIEGQRSLHDRPDNPDAVDLFFRARSMLDRNDTMEGLNAAQPLLEQAIGRQPDFVDAISELAWLLLNKVRNFDDPTDAEDMENARKLVDRAIGFSPQNARVLAAKGFLLKLNGHCQEAIATDQLALSFDPGDLDARSGIALCAVNLGHPEEAAKRLKEILLIDPQGQKNRSRYSQLGLVSLMLGHNEEAIEWFQKAMAGDSDPAVQAESLGRAEWNEIGLIAAYAGSGHLPEAQVRYAAYTQRWPHRTVWRLASYFTKAEAALPGFQAAMNGLKAAGMPEFAVETVDNRMAAPAEPEVAGDFDATPTHVPGAKTILTAEVVGLLHGEEPPVVVDVGRGAAVMSGALWIGQTFPSAAAEAKLKKEVQAATGDAPDHPIIVMGSSPFGWYAYNATLALVSFGYRHVSWYRGGEEAWIAAGLPADDRRDP